MSDPKLPFVPDVTLKRTCKITNNECGTDTWEVGNCCRCEECQAYLKESSAPRNGDHAPTPVKTTSALGAPVASGVPNAYPLHGSKPLLGVPNSCPMAINTSLDRLYLRPLQQPLFDTEYFVPGKGIKELGFFNRPIGTPFAHMKEEKSRHDTNLWQSQMLDYPREFSILGFRVLIDPKATANERDNLIREGLVTFYFAGNREYLNIPLSDIIRFDALTVRRAEIEAQKEAPPVGELSYQRDSLRIVDKKPKEAPVSEESKRNELIEMAAKLLEKACGSDFHKFNLGMSALKIKPGEAFGMKISWKKTPQVMKPLRITAMIVGLMWTPM